MEQRLADRLTSLNLAYLLYSYDAILSLYFPLSLLHCTYGVLKIQALCTLVLLFVHTHRIWLNDELLHDLLLKDN